MKELPQIDVSGKTNLIRTEVVSYEPIELERRRVIFRIFDSTPSEFLLKNLRTRKPNILKEDL